MNKDNIKEIVDVEEGHTVKELAFTKEIKRSFLDYSMSVIVSRALPDVRDGLKPVQRRIIYGMDQLGANPGSPHYKSARISGDVMGKYHPHGDSSIYEALVRMAQPFSYRYPLVDGHGNFGSIDGDGAAASRYTEARMSKLAVELVRDINKDVVDFAPNYDGREKEPIVLPSRFPNLLVNGSTGIAVGMATNIAPHNLNEVVDGTIAYIRNPEIDTYGLMEYIKGPDFPTGAVILGNSGIIKAYETGKGIINIRSKASIIEGKNNKQEILITEIPYALNKSRLIESIANLVKNKQIDGISDIRDESNMNGIKIIIELRREANANVVLNNLYKKTQLQQSFGINNLALVDGEPKVLSLKDMIKYYVEHQKEIIIRRTKFDLDKAEARIHILQGLKIAIDNIDEIVRLIKTSENDTEALTRLINNFKLTEIQAKAILEMKLRRLTGLEKDKVEAEIDELTILIADLKDILARSERVNEIIINELTAIKEKYGDDRRTTIDMTAIDYIEDEDLIPEEEIIITLTENGYIKRLNNDEFKIQNRGGVGIKGMTTNKEDTTSKMITMNTHNYILFFSNLGQVYKLKGYEIPEYGRQAKGLPIVNLLPIEDGEKITSVIEVRDGEAVADYLVFVTKNGLTKRTLVDEFISIRTTGKRAIVLKENDELISVLKSSGHKFIIVGASNGKLVKFKEEDVRVMGRTASGVRAMNLDGAEVVGADIVTDTDEILIVSENGYGKRAKVSDFRMTKRGAKGVKAMNTTDKTGKFVSLNVIHETEDEVLIITDNGIIIRLPLEQVSILGRNTQGTRLINLKDESKVATVSLTSSEEEETSEEE